MECVGSGWIKDEIQLRALLNMILNFQVPYKGEFLHQLRDYQLLTKNYPRLEFSEIFMI